MRLLKLKLECKVRMQLCAILSQLHRHKEALDQAYESAKLCNAIVNDQVDICEYLSKRVNFDNLNLFPHQSSQKQGNQNIQGGGTNQEESGAAIMVDNLSNYSEDGFTNMDEQSIDSIGQYQTYQGFINNLEDSISLIEKTAKKLLPIFKELQTRTVQFKSRPPLVGLSVDIAKDYDSRSDSERLDFDEPEQPDELPKSRERIQTQGGGGDKR